MERDVKAGLQGYAPVHGERARALYRPPRRPAGGITAPDSPPSDGRSNGSPVNGGREQIARPDSDGKPAVARDWAMTRALQLVGMRWNLLILREMFAGVHRFRRLERNIGIPRRTLALRLRLLIAHGLVERRARTDSKPAYSDYVLTDLGRDLLPAIEALQGWGERNYRALAERLLANS
jgi:DNA-binding HxlR family transcriptional regulator